MSSKQRRLSPSARLSRSSRDDTSSSSSDASSSPDAHKSATKSVEKFNDALARGDFYATPALTTAPRIRRGMIFAIIFSLMGAVLYAVGSYEMTTYDSTSKPGYRIYRAINIIGQVLMFFGLCFGTDVLFAYLLYGGGSK